MSKEEILAIIKENPEAIIESLSKKPELLISFILKLAPWDRFATKEDIKTLIDLFNRRFEELMHYSDKRFEELKAYSDKRFEAIDKRFEDLMHHSDKRFEDINKRFEDINRRFEDINKRFEDMNRRFEDINKRFEDIKYYVDKKVGLVEKLLIGFNLPILTGIIVMLIRLFIR